MRRGGRVEPRYVNYGRDAREIFQPWDGRRETFKYISIMVKPFKYISIMVKRVRDISIMVHHGTRYVNHGEQRQMMFASWQRWRTSLAYMANRCKQFAHRWQRCDS